jgi:uncharacterized glyoxalase superfamily protein PhnB
MGQAKPIPDGYHAVTPQLVLDDAAKAMEFYKDVFGAKEVMRMPGPGGKIWHAELQIGDSKIFLGDAMPGMGASPPTPDHPSSVSVMLYVPDADTTFKRALDAGARKEMDLQDMFWGDRGGSVVDPFGYRWFIATHVRDVTEDELRRAAQEALREAEASMGRGAPA